MKAGKVIFVGNLPPPVHGMSLVTAAVLDGIKARGLQPMVLDTAPPSLSRSRTVRLSRLPKVLKAFATILSTGTRNNGILYMSLSGAYGLLYDLLFLAAARMVGFAVLVHHHSYAYLTKRSRLAAACVRAVGSSGTHIVLCSDMEEKLRARYPRAKKVWVVSNTAFVQTQTRRPAARKNVGVVAFLGNISEAKGIWFFLEVAARLLESAPPPIVRLVVAGPFESQEVEKAFRKRAAVLSNVEYVGPKYGPEKADFFASVDVLLFPSTYRNEAEPLTIHEAHSNGIPVISSDRGCIRGMISQNGGVVVADMAGFVDTATRQLLAWIASPREFNKVSLKTLSDFDDHRNANRASAERLYDRLLGH